MRIGVICIGNSLLMDEGAGPACGRYLASRYEIPACVDILDRSVMGFAIMADLRSYDRVLVIDAVDVGAAPGCLFSFAPDDMAGSETMMSLHEVRFADVLQTAALMGVHCEGHCLGVQAENISPSHFIEALTPKVAAAVPLLAAEAARWLRAQTGEAVADRVAGADPLRAGQDSAAAQLAPVAAGARSFSGRHTPADNPAAGTGGSHSCGLDLPVIHGKPDASIMADYLQRGLVAIGAQDVCAAELDSSREAVADSSGSVEAMALDFTLPAAGPEGRARTGLLARRFGLLTQTEEGKQGPDGSACTQDAPGLYAFRAIVTPEITDYDCDALIGACLELLQTCPDRTASQAHTHNR